MERRRLNIIFLTIIDLHDINQRGIYHDLLRKFRDEGHNVYVIYPAERRKGEKTSVRVQEQVTLLKVRTLNIQKTNILEKGIGTVLLERQFLKNFKKHFSQIAFDLILYSTPPITFTKVISYIKRRDNAFSYLLLKDIFPQNAVDLGMMRKGGWLHNFFSKKEKKLYEISDIIGCMSPANVQFIKDHNPTINPAKVEVNPNSISIKESSAIDKAKIREKYQVPENATVFIYGGNLGKPQGIGFLLEVLESNLNNNEMFFIIAGGGTEFKVVEKWYKTNIPSNVLLFEMLPLSKYEELVKLSDVGLIFLDKRFSIPNFPSRLLLYLENKMPVLAATDRNTDLGKIILEAKCGFWCESNDLDSYNKVLTKFIKNENLFEELGTNSYKLLLQKYTIDVSYRTIISKIF